MHSQEELTMTFFSFQYLVEDDHRFSQEPHSIKEKFLRVDNCVMKLRP